MIHIELYQEERDYIHIINSCKQEHWQSFYEERKEAYYQALSASYTYVLYDDAHYCGFLRAISDGFFTLFVAEIIIDAPYRRQGYGRMLLQHAQAQLPLTRTDLISDNDDFYQSQGFHPVGTGMRFHNWY